MLKTPDQWFEEYGESHRHPVNKALHWVCVPLIVISLVGLLWSLPVPQAFRDISPALNWGTAFIMAATVYYFILSLSLALGMLPFVMLVVLAVGWLDRIDWPLWSLSGAIFVLAWAGQFVGHAIEGRKPSFFKDMQFLMIGPVWLLGFVYRRLGIPY
ncbi:MAG: DUF962 domain-containing protein [Gammaproteobacteria bacterium]|nr:DUF962 domain-containing protein [Gammaproteobacteria bacterium]TVQ49789.1 MAG: DUF962 domain-containing protein [Gammaproteobacteria bacterium]